jgi:hypothetical protein
MLVHLKVSRIISSTSKFVDSNKETGGLASTAQPQQSLNADGQAFTREFCLRLTAQFDEWLCQFPSLSRKAGQNLSSHWVINLKQPFHA